MNSRVTSSALVAGLLALFIFQCDRLAYRTSATFDEPGNIGAGLSYWRNGDFRITTWNLFLMQRLLTLPLAWDASPFPSGAEQDRLKRYAPTVGESQAIAVGNTYLFGMGSDHRALLGRARLMNAFVGAALGLLIFGWTRRVGGTLAGLFALTLYALSPAIVASASLVTIDIGATLLLNAAVWAYAWFLQSPSWRRATFAGFLLGLLLLTKFSAVAYAGLAGLLFLIWLLPFWPRDRPRWTRVAGCHAVGLFVAWLTIWAFFGFHTAPGGVIYAWDELGRGTWVGRTAQIARTLRLLPDPYAFDLGGLRVLAGKRYSYLHGQHHYGGSWDYFPIALAVKSTMAFLAALGIAAAVAATHLPRMAAKLRADFAHALPMVVMAAGFSALCLMSNINIGFRHIFPALPGLFGAVGIGLAWLWRRSRGGRSAVISLLGLAAVEAAVAAPHPHAYFNALVGGPMGGYRWLVDTSMDWGADLPEFAAWESDLAAREPGVAVFLAYHGVDPIEAYGVHARNLMRPFTRADLTPGYYAFSARLLWSGTDGRPGPFDQDYENEYQGLHAQSPSRLDAGKRAALCCLQIDRLADYCRHRPPAMRVGPVYFIFKLDANDLARALDLPLPPSLIEPPMRL